MYRIPLLVADHGHRTSQRHTRAADPVAVEPEVDVRLRDCRDGAPGHGWDVYLARGIVVSESAQDAGRWSHRRRVGGEGDRAQTALLPHHREGTRGAAGEGAILDRVMPGREPH